MANAPYFEKGRYRCRIEEQALGAAKTGNPQFVLRFTVLGRVISPDEIVSVANYERHAYLTITEKTAERIIGDLHRIGFTRDSFRYLDPATPNHHSFVGQEVDMWCDHEARQDRTGDREKWSITRGSKPLEVKPIDSAAVRRLDNLFGKQLKAKLQAAQPATGASAEVTDDDIPF